MEESMENGFVTAEDDGSAERRRKRMDDSSAAIAVKLLQGWTLLNDHCPQCLTPLVRNRERRLYCVNCCQWVITETEAAAQVLENRADTSQSLEEAATVSEPAPENRNLDNVQPRMRASSPVNDEENPNQFGSFRPSDEVFLEPTHRIVPSTVAVSIPHAVSEAGIDGAMGSNDRVPSREESGRLTSLGLPKVNMPSNTGAVLSQTVSSLVQKIEEMSQLIAVTNPQNLKQLLETIEHCIRVIQQIVALGTR